MNAAGKLKALDNLWRDGFLDEVDGVRLLAALPQIVALVEAAERLADSTDDDWFYSGGRAQTMRVLAALDEALSPPTGGSP